MKAAPVLLAALVLAASRVHAEAALPDDLCDAQLPAATTGTDGEPVIQSWSSVQWDPPSCLGWPSGKYRLVVEVAGRIEGVDDTEIRRRLGAISQLRGTRYWSVTESSWKELITEASALGGPGGEPRADFAPGEIRRDATLFFSQTDNRSSKPVAYSMKVIDATPVRIIVKTANDSPIESMMLTLFPPGSLHAAYVLTRTAPRSWSFHALSATTGEASGMVMLSKESFVNRAKALFAHLAGTPL